MTLEEIDYLQASQQAARRLLADGAADRLPVARELTHRWQADRSLRESQAVSRVGGYWADLEVPDAQVDLTPCGSIPEKLKLIAELSDQKPTGGPSPAP